MHLDVIEDALIDCVKTALKDKVREIESMPGGWSLDMLNRSLQFAPAVYVAYQGSSIGKDEFSHNARFTVYVVSKGANEANRRSGNSRVIGAYDMLKFLAPALGQLNVKGVGRVSIKSIDNLFRDALFDVGGSVYGIQLSTNSVAFDELETGDLSEFLTLETTHSVGSKDTPDVHGTTKLRSKK